MYRINKFPSEVYQSNDIVAIDLHEAFISGIKVTGNYEITENAETVLFNSSMWS